VPEPLARPCFHRPRPLLVAAIALVVLGAACGGGHSRATSTSSSTAPSGDQVTPAQLAEAKRLVNIGDSPQPPPAPVVACVAATVVQNPFLDQVANDIAQVPDKDARQAVMYAYLQCGYSYITDTYMRFAPAGLTPTQLACIRSKFTQLDPNRFAEVIVEDPDAGYTGPLVIAACKSGAKKNPLLNPDGSLIDMGGGS
jgi:hypothetical protein